MERLGKSLQKHMKRQYLKINIDRLYPKRIETYSGNTVSFRTKYVATIRSYQWNKAVEEGKGVIIKCRQLNQTMTIQWEDLKNVEKGERAFQSKSNPLQTYHLYDFDWKEDEKKVEPVQFGIFDTMLAIQGAHK